MPYLPDSCKVRSGLGVSAQPPANKAAGLIEEETKILKTECRKKKFYPSRASGSDDRFLLI
jgi:hypothetical protein